MPDALHGPVTIGIDVGQRVDSTAICVAQSTGESRLPYNPLPLWHHEVRAIDRLPLGMPYPDQARRIKAIVDGVIDLTVGVFPRVCIDATGVGTALVDELRAANVLAQITPVYFTHGDKRVLRLHANTKQPFLSLGKAWLVTRLQVLLQRQSLRLPTTALMRTLTDELLNYEIKIDKDGDDKYGAFRVGTHDDLVTALGLAVLDDAAGGGAWDERSAQTAPILPPGGF